MGSVSPAALILCALLAGAPAAGQAPPVPPVLPPGAAPGPYVQKITTRVRTRGPRVQVRVEEVFANPAGRPAEGEFLYPVPPDVQVRRFVLRSGGRTLQAELLEADRARRSYEEIVRRRADPGLLEFLGWGLCRARVFPVPPRGRATVTLEYETLLPHEDGLTELRLPLAGRRPETKVVVQADLETRAPLQAVYSPSHAVDTHRTDPRHARVSYEGPAGASRTLVLYYREARGDVGLQVFPFRRGGEDGYLLLIFSPPPAPRNGRALPKDVVLILDTSGSMRDAKLAQAKKAVRYILERLDPRDRFDLFAFGGGVRPFREGLVPATGENLAAALDFVRRLEAAGGTNLYDAVRRGLASFRDTDRIRVAVLLTDGEPTVEETDPDRIVAAAREANRAAARLFVFGVGDELHVPLLDRLARENRGCRTYVDPRDDLAEKLSRFYARIRYPVLGDLELRVPEDVLGEVYPHHLPDLFHGSQLLLVGRYRRPGRYRLELVGQVEGRAVRREYTVELPARSDRFDFVPRLWAVRKVGYLLDRYRLTAKDPAAKQKLRQAIVKLSRRYGILTPFTAYLAREDEPPPGPLTRRAPAPSPVPERRRISALGPSGGRPQGYASSAATGPQAVALSRLALGLQGAVRGNAGLRARTGAPGPGIELVGSKVFVRRGKTWVDTAYVPRTMAAKVRRVEAFSAAYFRLLRDAPPLARYFAVGRHVIVLFGDEVYEVYPPGKTPAKASTPRDTG